MVKQRNLFQSVQIMLMLSLAWLVFSLGNSSVRRLIGQANYPQSGMNSTMLTSLGSPSGVWACNSPTLDVDSSTVVTGGRFWLCANPGSGYAWTNLPNSVSYYLNNTAQAGARCDFLTATANSSGVATFDYSAMGFTTILGQPQPSVQANPGTVALTSFNTTGATVNVTAGTVISILTINIVSFAGAALPSGLFVCGI